MLPDPFGDDTTRMGGVRHLSRLISTVYELAPPHTGALISIVYITHFIQPMGYPVTYFNIFILPLGGEYDDAITRLIATVYVDLCSQFDSAESICFGGVLRPKSVVVSNPPIPTLP